MQRGEEGKHQHRLVRSKGLYTVTPLYPGFGGKVAGLWDEHTISLTAGVTSVDQPQKLMM